MYQNLPQALARTAALLLDISQEKCLNSVPNVKLWSHGQCQELNNLFGCSCTRMFLYRKGKINMNTRFVNFKNVIYDLRNGNRIRINPVAYWDKNNYNNLIEMGAEKYFIKTERNLNKENIGKETLNNFNNFLSNYLEALRRLT